MKKLIIPALAGALALSACTPAATRQAPVLLPEPPMASRSIAPPVSASAHFDNGYRMFQGGHYRQASRAFERAMEINPADYKAAYFLGMSHLNRTRYSDARRAFRHGLELGPDRQTASRMHVGLAYTYEAVRFTRRAHQHYHLACAAYKGNRYAQVGARRTEYVSSEHPGSK